MDNAYYAVRPDLVLLAKSLFHIRPSTLDAGEKRLLLSAQAIADGRREDRWGHHAASVVQRYCAYTQDANGTLPWQELLEDEAIYDGAEGVAARTGNRPLGTTRRYQVQAESLAAQLQSEALTAAECAQILAVPQQFVEAMLDGRWPSISEFMAEQLCARWGQAVATRAESAEMAATPVHAGASSADERVESAPWRPVVLVAVGLVVIVVAGVLWRSASAPAPLPALEAEIVGYWNYDGVDGQHLARGVVVLNQPGAGLGAQWQRRLEIANHAELPPRTRTLWPVELHRSERRVCVNYPDYPTYSAFIDFPDADDDGIYQFGPCD